MDHVVQQEEFLVGGNPFSQQQLIMFKLQQLGNAKDFGDLIQLHSFDGACSNGHGGL